MDTIDLKTRKRVIRDFLRRSNCYAEAKITQYTHAVEQASVEERLLLQEKITRWTTYIVHNQYVLHNLDGSQLDQWLLADAKAATMCGD